MSLAALIARQGFVVLDGGLATELERGGADLHDPLWSAKALLEAPDRIQRVHQAFFAAGADVAISASYQASITGFGERGLGPAEARRLMGSSVALAQRARERFWESSDRMASRAWPLVAGSVGPFGAARADGSEYTGSYGVSRQQLADFHGPRLEALTGAGADLLAIETCPSPTEADVVLELLRSWPDTQVWVAFTCRDERTVSEGQAVTEVIAAVAVHPQVSAVGFNCVPPRLVDGLLEQAGSVTTKPLVVYPNSGERWDVMGRRWLAGDAACDFGESAPRWRARGAQLIGGCCRTTPDTIRRIREALE